MSDSVCSEQSLAAGEPLAGSAVSETDRWLVLEHAGAWGPKGVEDSGLDAGLVAHLAELGARHRRLRVQLVRQPGDRDAPVRPRVYFASSGERARALSSLALDRLEQLVGLALEPWLRGEADSPGQPELDPLFLVCVHGKRDRCCAQLGLPVYRALRELAGERVLQTTHLGGHRFAATLLTLPDGVSYGRVQPAEAEPLVAATGRGELYDLARVRGRTAYASPAQAAEVALRERLGERRLDALALLEVNSASKREHRVRFCELASGREHELEVRREPLPPFAQSCGGPEKPGARLVVLNPASG